MKDALFAPEVWPNLPPAFVNLKSRAATHLVATTADTRISATMRENLNEHTDKYAVKILAFMSCLQAIYVVKNLSKSVMEEKLRQKDIKPDLVNGFVWAQFTAP